MKMAQPFVSCSLRKWRATTLGDWAGMTIVIELGCHPPGPLWGCWFIPITESSNVLISLKVTLQVRIYGLEFSSARLIMFSWLINSKGPDRRSCFAAWWDLSIHPDEAENHIVSMLSNKNLDWRQTQNIYSENEDLQRKAFGSTFLARWNDKYHRCDKFFLARHIKTPSLCFKK